MQQYKQIVIIGNVGAGKSTLTDLLVERLPAKQVPADSLFKTNPFFPLAVSDRSRWSLTSDLWFLYERVKLARQTAKILEKQHVVVDSGLPMSFVYSHSRIGSGYFTADEWNFYKAIYDELTSTIAPPELVIYLKASMNSLEKRIKKRGREYELKFFTREYLAALEESLEVLIDELYRRQIRVMEINGEKGDFLRDSDFVDEMISTLLE